MGDSNLEVSNIAMPLNHGVQCSTALNWIAVLRIFRWEVGVKPWCIGWRANFDTLEVEFPLADIWTAANRCRWRGAELLGKYVASKVAVICMV